jgi:hypothetical protein
MCSCKNFSGWLEFLDETGVSGGTLASQSQFRIVRQIYPRHFLFEEFPRGNFFHLLRLTLPVKDEPQEREHIELLKCESRRKYLLHSAARSDFLIIS